MLSVTNWRFELSVNPLRVDALEPHFSWALEHAGKAISFRQSFDVINSRSPCAPNTGALNAYFPPS